MDTKPHKSKGVKASLEKSMREIAPFMNLGLQMAIPIVGLVFLGLWLDGKNGTSPLYILLGAGVGLFAAFYYFFKAVKTSKTEKK